MKQFCTILLFLTSCVISTSCVTLGPVSISKTESIYDYQYVYITPTDAINSTTGGVYNGYYGVYGSTSSKSANPADLISGYFIKKGFIRIPELSQDLSDKTLIINYGETGSRGVFIGTVTEVTIQFLSAQTMEPICTVTGEGYGETEADDIRIAINRCLDKVFD